MFEDSVRLWLRELPAGLKGSSHSRWSPVPGHPDVQVLKSVGTIDTGYWVDGPNLPTFRMDEDQAVNVIVDCLIKRILENL